MKFVDVKNDIAFRKIFGNENRKETLISFLNAVLDFQGDQRITQVTILNPYQLPRLKGGKVTIIDVKATDHIGRTYIVEMQVAPGNINDEGLKSAYEEANVQTWTQEELDAYEYAFMREEDERARLDKAEQKGKQEGKVEIVLEMYGDGFPVDKIARLVKMTVPEVEQVIVNQSNK
jgi:hypothetical protein